MKKEYKKDDLVVGWEPDKCEHEAQCIMAAGKVFRPRARPWVNVDGGTKEEIIAAIDLCPSKALTYRIEE